MRNRKPIRVNVRRLNSALKESGMTKVDLSRRGPFGYNTVMNIFRGSVKWVRIDTMERLCQLLDVGVEEFFEYGKPKAR